MLPATAIAHMRRALAIARLGAFATVSNPLVGCVLVGRDGVISEGWHAGDGKVHAEAMALAKASQDFRQLSGATAFVTLEPCCHTGRQPPCTEALIAAGIARVVIGSGDPHHVVAGKGMAQLRAGGIAVTSGLLESDCRALNPGFFHRHRHQLPWVVVKLAISLDGRIAAADGSSNWISCKQSRMDAMRLRAGAQAVLTSSSTVTADNPRLNVRGLDQSPPATAAGITQPEVWIIDRTGSVDPASRVFAKVDHTSSQPSPRNVVWLRPPASLPVDCNRHTTIRTPSDYQLTTILQLMAQQGINQVVTECGGRLAGSLLASGLVNQLVLYQAPILLGHTGIAMAQLPIRTITEAMQWTLTDRRQIGRDTRLTYLASRQV